MRVIYQPEIPAGELPGAIGFFVGDEVIRIVPHTITEVPDHLWARLEREPGIATMLAEGTLRPA